MKRFNLQLLVVTGFCCGLVFGVFALSQDRTANNLVAHEWGTFTSIQGSDGVPMFWQSTNVAPLPAFVYDWSHPGLDGNWVPGDGFGKAMMVTMQRMETPVIYFYSDREQFVDVQVNFPRGKMTEWFPRAAEAGPAVLMDGTNRTRRPSMLHWPQVHVLPSTANLTLPADKTGTHYYAARETDSANLEIDTITTNRISEFEKFLFYRGVGNFKTPLKAAMSTGSVVTLENTGNETLHDLFVLHVEHGNSSFVHVKALKPGHKRDVTLAKLDSIAATTGRLSNEVANSLVRQHLFRREAEAMVKTWKDSWLEEEGIRVLYLLPSKWTDETLPLHMSPQPRELVRVMVGRAEIISPEVEHRIADTIIKVNAGDFGAKIELRHQLDLAGRFASPLLTRSFSLVKIPLIDSSALWTNVWPKVNQAISAPLAFDSQIKECSVKPGQDEAHFTFKVANFSAVEVVVERAQGSCGCTQATLPARPWHIKPGQVSEIPVVMFLKGKPPGQIAKEVKLFTSAGERTLMVKTVIPAPEPIKTAAVSR